MFWGRNGFSLCCITHLSHTSLIKGCSFSHQLFLASVWISPLRFFATFGDKRSHCERVWTKDTTPVVMTEATRQISKRNYLSQQVLSQVLLVPVDAEGVDLSWKSLLHVSDVEFARKHTNTTFRCFERWLVGIEQWVIYIPTRPLYLNPYHFISGC